MTLDTVISPFPRSGHSHRRCLRTALSRAESACAARGLRLTPLRRRVLELVWSSHEPSKAYDLLERLRREHHGAAPPTVYRALEFLTRQGLVHRIESQNAFVGCGEPGHRGAGQFLICRSCGDAAEIKDRDIIDLIAAKARQVGFSIDRQTVELEGLCEHCRTGADAR